MASGLVCEAQVPLVKGGAESHVRQLVDRLRGHGYQVDLVSVPFKWYPKEEILAHAAAWRLLDLSESNGTPIDLVIATKFPSYFVRHPNKVAWLIHQYRAAYELCGTTYSDFAHVDLDVGIRQQLIALDTQMLGECRRLYTNAGNTAARVEEVQRAAGGAALSSAEARGPHHAGLRAGLRPVGRPPRNREAARPGDPGDGPRAAPKRLVIVGEGTQESRPARAHRRARPA